MIVLLRIISRVSRVILPILPICRLCIFVVNLVNLLFSVCFATGRIHSDEIKIFEAVGRRLAL